jgi:hypothetical protein
MIEVEPVYKEGCPVDEIPKEKTPRVATRRGPAGSVSLAGDDY